MTTQFSRDLFGYEVVEGRQVVAALDGGDNTSGRRRAVARAIDSYFSALDRELALRE